MLGVTSGVSALFFSNAFMVVRRLSLMLADM